MPSMVSAPARRLCRSAIASILVAFPTVTAAGAAHADPILGKALFDKGNEASKRGDYKLACEYFRDSYKHAVTVGVMFKLAECEEKLGNLASAWQHYKRVIEELDGKPEGRRSDRLKLAKQRAPKLEPKVPWLTIQLDAGAPAGTTVSRDDVEVGKAELGVAQPLDPGRHWVVVTAPEHKEKRYPIIITDGMKQTLKVEPGPALRKPSKQAAELPARPPEPSRSPTLGWVMGIGGATMVAGGVTLLLLSLGDVADAEKAQDQADLTTGVQKQEFVSEAFDATSRANTKQWVGGIGMGLGSALAGLGVYWVLSADRTEKTRDPLVAVTPMPVAHGVQVLYRF